MHLSCSVLSCKAWYNLLVGEAEDVVRQDGLMEADDSWRQRKPFFQSESQHIALCVNQAIHKSDLLLKRLKHVFVPNCVIYFWQKDQAVEEILACVDCIGVGMLPGRPMGFRMWLVMFHRSQLTKKHLGVI